MKNMLSASKGQVPKLQGDPWKAIERLDRVYLMAPPMDSFMQNADFKSKEAVAVTLQADRKGEGSSKVYDKIKQQEYNNPGEVWRSVIMSNSIIYYYSGTGNSLHVARKLKNRLPGTELVPILSVLKKGTKVREAEQVGLVFPIYVSTVPKPVRAFIDTINLSSTQYFYTVTTNGGFPGKVDYLVYKLLKSKGLELDYYASLKMIVNTATGLMPAIMVNRKWVDMISADKVAKMEVELQKELDLVAEDVAKRVKNIGPDCNPNLARRALLSITEKMSPMEKNNEISFLTDHDCNGCGTCEKVCPSEKIRLADGKPRWSETTQCYYCYACFNFCLQQAILVKGYKYKTGRYKHPSVSANDIAGQKDLPVFK